MIIAFYMKHIEGGENMRNDSMARVLTITVLSILGLWLVYTLLFGSGMSIGMGYRGFNGGEHMSMGYSIGFGSSFAYLLLMLVKVLFVVFAVALVAGIFVWIKNSVFTKEDVETIKNTFTGNSNLNQKEQCVACGRTMEADWRLCPHCGKEKGL